MGEEMNTLVTVCLWISGITAGICVFVAMLFYAAYVISSPVPPKVPRIVQIIMLPFCYIVAIGITFMNRDWKIFKNIRKWKF